MELTLEPNGSAAAPPAPRHQRQLGGSIVAVRGLTKRFPDRRSVGELARLEPRRPPVTVVDAIDLDVVEGEVFGLLGPNGAGKTTIFKMLSTMVTPDAGIATIAGFDIRRERSSIRSVLASVPAEERSLNWRLSAVENLRLFAALQRVPTDECAARITSTLATVGLAETGEKRVGEFSAGMRQRLLIARALITRPRILLLDEPTRTLDPVSARELRRFLRDELVTRQRCTILLATHNAEEAFDFCDRAAVLHRGRVLAVGAADELTSCFGEERYLLLTRTPDHPGFTALERRGLLQRKGVLDSTTDGWTNMDCVITGGPPRCAEVLRMLAERGVEVARLERIELSLADLITHIVRAHDTETGHA